jgi:hypothetical protein
MNPPFLDLAYYVGAKGVDVALRSIALDAGSQGIIGLTDRREEVSSSGGAVVVRTEGEDFCGAMREGGSRMQGLGQQVSAAFMRIAESIDCLYGAILIEYRLETPEELRRDPRSLAFQDFYLSRRFLAPNVVSSALSVLPKQAFVRELERGVYVSMSREYNPESRGLESEVAQSASADVARLIGKWAR